MGFLDQTRLHELEELCVQEQPPACMSGCPLHVDGRSICSAIAAGDFDAALAVYRKAVPFPGILSRVCSQHCSNSCKRGEAGDPLLIRGLEEAACRYGQEKKPRRLLPRVHKSIAVVGGGISGVTAAYELGRKGYRVTLYEQAEQIGGQLLKSDIPPQVLAAEFARLKDYPITVKCGTRITDAAELTADYDAVYVAWGLQDNQPFLPCRDSFQTGQESIFAGGYGICQQSYDTAMSMADGKRAAVSIDRYLKAVSMTAGREREDVFESTLYVNMAGVQNSYCVGEPPFSREQAIAEAARCLDCKCLECVKDCTFLKEYKTYPRKYVREVYNNLSIAMGNRHANRMINSCSLCGQCKARCPQGLDVAKFTKEARQTMVADGKMPVSAFEFGLRDMEHANSEELALIRHQAGFTGSRYLFFPGCQIGASAPEVTLRTYQDLCARMPGGVGIYLGCCGIAADWAGEQERYQERLKKLHADWQKLGCPVVITACPSCYKVWKEEIAEAEAIGIWSLLDGSEAYASVRAAVRGSERGPAVTVMDACGAREFGDIHDQVRHLLTELGYQIEAQSYEREISGCCGFGGLLPVSNQKLARQMAADRVTERDRYYLTYCMNCRDRYTNAGASAIHLLELFYGSGKVHQPPTWSERQRRRRWLKQTLLKEMWQEQTEGREEMKLYYSDQIKEQLEDRMILEEDLAETIEAAEQSQAKLEDTKEHCFIAGKQIGNVYFWVYYREQEDGYEILKAYSHRMSFR